MPQKVDVGGAFLQNLENEQLITYCFKMASFDKLKLYPGFLFIAKYTSWPLTSRNGAQSLCEGAFFIKIATKVLLNSTNWWKIDK